MIKGRLFVVNEKTRLSTIENNEVSIATPQPTGQQWLKTIADIMADMLQIEIGDYIFLWETKTQNQKSQIYGVYRAISKPFYKLNNEDDRYPFKIKIEPAYFFENPLDEYDVLNCPYIKAPLWTITGKKVAGKSRGTSPLSIDEAKNLITLLIGKNPDFRFYPFNDKNIIDVANPLSIDYSLIGDNIGISTLKDINPNKLCYFNSDYSIKYEKILETIFNQEMSARNKNFFSQIGVAVDDAIWFCNYLPYSIEQSEMDYLIIESVDKINPTKIFLIEFIKEEIDESHIFRSILYSKWVNETLTLGTSIVQPLIICAKSVDFINGETSKLKAKKLNKLNDYIAKCVRDFGTRDLQVFTYDFSGLNPKFTRKK